MKHICLLSTNPCLKLTVAMGQGKFSYNEEDSVLPILGGLCDNMKLILLNIVRF